ncbi:hypothetical protein BM1_06422 [Bipolaris maydis]|nr:hypothetical protein BM1_06422 [Bipolaris maydis]
MSSGSWQMSNSSSTDSSAAIVAPCKQECSEVEADREAGCGPLALTDGIFQEQAARRALSRALLSGSDAIGSPTHPRLPT